jgi:hypothetical protein
VRNGMVIATLLLGHKTPPQYSLSVCIGPVARLSGVGAGMPVRHLTNQQLAVNVLLDDLSTLGIATCPKGAEPMSVESSGVDLMFQAIGEKCAATPRQHYT